MYYRYDIGNLLHVLYRKCTIWEMYYMCYIGVLNLLYRSQLIVGNRISNDRSFLTVVKCTIREIYVYVGNVLNALYRKCSTCTI